MNDDAMPTMPDLKYRLEKLDVKAGDIVTLHCDLMFDKEQILHLRDRACEAMPDGVRVVIMTHGIRLIPGEEPTHDLAELVRVIRGVASEHAEVVEYALRDARELVAAWDAATRRHRFTDG